MKRIITTRKKLPDFYSVENLDSLIKNSIEITDTATVVRYHSNGELAELKYPDGASQLFEENGCNEEISTFLDTNGDTIQKYQTIFKNGVVIKTKWTISKPIKSEVITDYYDYKFNKHGHWKKRKYRGNNGVIIEWRKLIYY
ncbi:MAG: hypothetical protein GY810_01365 [Aureispira sp.]|nr:hypothetical protein [Aureispira sp.]